MLTSPVLRAALVLLLLAAGGPAAAQVITVTSPTDDGAGCTLREAVEAANTNAPVGGCETGFGSTDEVRFASGITEVVLTQGEIRITEGVYLGSSATTIRSATRSRIFHVVDAGEVWIEGVLRDGFAEGGAMWIEGDTVVEFSGSLLANASPGVGGALRVTGGATFRSTGATFRGNGARTHGGAIYVGGGGVQLDGPSFEANISRHGSGGALYVDDGSYAFVEPDGAFVDNRARLYGGAAAARGTGRLSLDGVRIESNMARQGGAVAALEGGEASVFLGEATRNRAETGGALWVGVGSSFRVGGSGAVTPLTNNRAVEGAGGGAIYSEGTLRVENVRFERNQTTRWGGAVLVGGGTADFVGSRIAPTFRRNRGEAGGALAVRGPGAAEVSLASPRFEANMSFDDGGALYVESSSATVEVSGSSLQDGVFSQNTADGAGGAIALVRGTLALTDVRIDGNHSRSADAPTGGGAISVTGGALSGLRVEVAGNRSVSPGGGLALVGGAVTFEASTFRTNRTSRHGGAVATAALGDGSLTLTDVDLSENQTVASEPGISDGGGIYHAGRGPLLLDGSRLVENRAEGGGGGLWTSGPTRIFRTTVEGNRADQGGGVHGAYGGSDAVLDVEQSAVLFNSAAEGGGLYVVRPTTVLNTTIYGNDGGVGGGIFTDRRDLDVDSATIAENLGRRSAGGIYKTGGDNGIVSLRNTIVADNSVNVGFGRDLVGRFNSRGYNLIGTTVSANTFYPRPSDKLGVNPRLRPLRDNGGPTRTVGLIDDSPAIDAGNSVAVDQRGYRRSDAQDDIGAFEAGASPQIAAPPAAGLEAPAPGLDVVPNPAAGRATVRLTVAETQRVTVAVYDVTGRRALTLFDGVLEGGLEARIPVGASRLAAGVYVVVAEGEGLRASTRLSVVR